MTGNIRQAGRKFWCKKQRGHGILMHNMSKIAWDQVIKFIYFYVCSTGSVYVSHIHSLAKSTVEHWDHTREQPKVQLFSKINRHSHRYLRLLKRPYQNVRVHNWSWTFIPEFLKSHVQGLRRFLGLSFDNHFLGSCGRDLEIKRLISTMRG